MFLNNRIIENFRDNIGGNVNFSVLCENSFFSNDHDKYNNNFNNLGYNNFSFLSMDKNLENFCNNNNSNNIRKNESIFLPSNNTSSTNNCNFIGIDSNNHIQMYNNIN